MERIWNIQNEAPDLLFPGEDTSKPFTFQHNQEIIEVSTSSGFNGYTIEVEYPYEQFTPYKNTEVYMLIENPQDNKKTRQVVFKVNEKQVPVITIEFVINDSGIQEALVKTRDDKTYFTDYTTGEERLSLDQNESDRSRYQIYLQRAAQAVTRYIELINNQLQPVN